MIRAVLMTLVVATGCSSQTRGTVPSEPAATAVLSPVPEDLRFLDEDIGMVVRIRLAELIDSITGLRQNVVALANALPACGIELFDKFELVTVGFGTSSFVCAYRECLAKSQSHAFGHSGRISAPKSATGNAASSSLPSTNLSTLRGKNVSSISVSAQ